MATLFARDWFNRPSIAQTELALGTIYLAAVVLLSWQEDRLSNPPPITIAADQPTTISADRPVTITAERPFSVSSPGEMTLLAEQPISVSADRPVEILADRPTAVSGVQPVTIPAGRSVTVSADRPATLMGERPITVSSERAFTISAPRPVHITVRKPGSPQEEPGPDGLHVQVPPERPVVVSAERVPSISGLYAVSLPAFLIATSIFLTGAFALLLEARVIMPAKVTRWLKLRRGVPEKEPSRSVVPWFPFSGEAIPDLAVVQLVFASVIVPLLTLTPPFADFGWRLLAITIASGTAYLAFLGSQITKVSEVTSIIDEIRLAQQELEKGAKEDVGKESGEVQSKTERLTELVKDLEDRADTLCRELGFVIHSSTASQESGSGQPAATS